MTPLRIYRFSIWLPLIIPAALILAMNIWIYGLGLPKPGGTLDYVLEVIGSSGTIGGIPYLALAIWAMWWTRGRSEEAIRRLMFIAPILMVAAFTLMCAILGLLSARVSIWMKIAARGDLIIILLGYAYVAVAVLLRRTLAPPAI